MPVPINIREAKDIISDRLLRPRKISEVHGVGVAKVGVGSFHLRIYVTNLNAQDLPERLSGALELNGPAFPALPSFPLGLNFANQFPGKPWLENLVVDVVQSPRSVLAVAASTTPNDLARDPNCKFLTPLNPLPAGLSVGRSGSSEIGTIGFFCKDSQPTPNKYLVSCSHVLAGSTTSNFSAAKGTKILRNPLSSSSDYIGKLQEFITLTSIVPGTFPQTNWSPSLVNRADAAIAKMNAKINEDRKPVGPAMGISPWVIGPVKMSGTVAPDPGLMVTKHGFASCTTEGEIDDPLCDFAVLNNASPQMEFLFVDQFRIVRQDKNDPPNIIRFATNGDSGSLIYTVTNAGTSTVNNPVGLLFAVGNKLASLGPKDILEHSGDVEYALATPVATVLSELNAKIVPAGSNISAKNKISLMT